MALPSFINMQATPLNYDYSKMPDAAAQAAQDAARKIKPKMRRAVEDVIVIGGILSAVKAQIPHGQWGAWLAAEFELTDRSARNFMGVHEKFNGKTEIISDLNPTMAYALLSLPGAVEEIEAMPTPPTKAEAKRIISAHKTPKLTGEVLPPEPDAAGQHTPRGTCKICSRPLTDGQSITNGMGPCCYAKSLKGSGTQASTERTILVQIKEDMALDLLEDAHRLGWDMDRQDKLIEAIDRGIGQ